VDITNLHSRVKYPFPTAISISLVMGYKLRQILQMPYYVLLFHFMDKKLTPLKMPLQFQRVTRATNLSFHPNPMLPPYTFQSAPNLTEIPLDAGPSAPPDSSSPD